MSVFPGPCPKVRLQEMLALRLLYVQWYENLRWYEQKMVGHVAFPLCHPVSESEEVSGGTRTGRASRDAGISASLTRPARQEATLLC